jgi:hypothetical protein
MPDIRRRLRSAQLPDREDIGPRLVFRWSAMGVFFVAMVALLIISVTADIVLLGILAATLLSQMLYVILPMENIRAKARRLYTGEAGEDAYEQLEERGGRFR